MSNHLAQTTLRDHLAKCVLAFSPHSALDSRRAGWVPTGAPKFSRSGGVVLDGVADYLSRNPLEIFAGLTQLSFHCLFSPKFSTSLDAVVAFWDLNAPGGRYYFLKGNNASANVFQVRLGGTYIGSIAESVYSDLWVQGGFNLLSLSSKSADTSVYLNGETIMDSDPSAWSPQTGGTLYLGADNVGASFFNGSIYELKFYNSLITLADHLAIWRKAS